MELCTECIDAKRDPSNTCISCLNGYYLDASLCKACSKGCIKCMSFELCLECTTDSSFSRQDNVIENCPCLSSYYDDQDIICKGNDVFTQFLISLSIHMQIMLWLPYLHRMLCNLTERIA